MSAATACLPVAPPSLSSAPSHRRSAELAAEAELTKASGGAAVIGAEALVQAGSHGGSVERAGTDGDVSKPRAVVRTLTCERKQVVEGFALWRSIGRPELPDLDPFLTFDEFEFSPPAGFLDHPHRGFETVTYMLEVTIITISSRLVSCKGGFSYHDFSGHKGTINTGDVQWMTAGRGVVHAEMPGGGGVQRGISIWINLSSKDKMVEPRYQETASDDVPVADKDGVRVKVIAGDSLGARSQLRPRTPAMCLDVTLRPGARLRQPVPRGWSACAYVIGGEAIFEGAAAAAARARTLVVFGADGDGVDVRAREEAGAGARVMLVAARPHGEAVVRDGPFVMNTSEEVEQAREDYRRRRNGFEMADGWTSDHVTRAAAH